MLSAPDLVVVAHNAPPATGGIERLVDGLCTHVAPGRTTLVRPPGPVTPDAAYDVHEATLVRSRPPRWRPAQRALAEVSPSAATVCAEWWPAARALAGSGRGGHRTAVVHGTEITRALGNPRVRRALVGALGTVDSVVAISTYTAEVCASVGIDAVVVPPPVDPVGPGDGDHDDEVLAGLALPDGPVVLTVARLIERKGHRQLLERWSRVATSHPDAVWVLAGDGPEMDGLRSIAPPSVRLLGRVDDRVIGALHRRADVHVLPGIVVDHAVEGYGMAAVEAGSAGTPTLATDLGGVAEAVADGGIVVPAGAHDALVDELIALLGDHARRARLGALARAHAEASTWTALAPRWRRVVGLETARTEAA